MSIPVLNKIPGMDGTTHQLHLPKSPTCRGSNDPPKTTCSAGWRQPLITKPTWCQHMLKRVGWRQRSRQGCACLRSHKVAMQKPQAFQTFLGACLLLCTGACVPRAPRWGILRGGATRKILLEPLQGRIWLWVKGWDRIKRCEVS